MYRLIHIEPDAAKHRAVAEALTQGPYPFAVEQVRELGTAPPVTEPETVDAVLVRGQPGGPVVDDLRRCRGWFPGRPVIVLTEVAGMTFAQELLRAGAHDVVLQQERALAVLARILLYAIERAGAERRQELLRLESSGLRALLDTLVGNPFDSVLQTDAEGLIERASPLAAKLMGLDAATLAGRHLEEQVEHSDRSRLAAFLDLTASSTRPMPMTFPFLIEGRQTRILEVEPIPLGIDLARPPRLFRLAELVADFADEAPPATAAADRAEAPPEAPGRKGGRGGAAGPAGKSLELLGRIAKTTVWRCVLSSAAPGGRLGFLSPDAKTAEGLAGLVHLAGENAEFTLALDRLQIAAWLHLASSGSIGSRHRLVFEVSYATCTSHPQLERLRAEVADRMGELASRLIFQLRNVPAGIHLPSLAKVTRAFAKEHGRPGLELADLEQEYRLLPFDHLALLTVPFADLKRALAADAKALSSLLRRARDDGALVAVRGAAGPLAEKLRQRLPVDLTVGA